MILSSLEQGIREGRVLLHEWLVNLVAQYNDAFKLAEYGRGSLTTSHVDVSFSQCPQLQSLPRLIFALLRNPLLRFHEEGVHPDYRIYLQCLFRYASNPQWLFYGAIKLYSTHNHISDAVPWNLLHLAVLYIHCCHRMNLQINKHFLAIP